MLSAPTTICMTNTYLTALPYSVTARISLHHNSYMMLQCESDSEPGAELETES